MKKTRIAALVFALCFGAAAMTGCGDEKSSNKAEKTEEKKTEQTIENSDENTDEEEATEEVEDETNAEGEIVYNPKKEIMEAGLRSGLIQINGDVFHNGGYLTVNEFIEKYSDKYDMSEVDPEAEFEKGTYSFTAYGNDEDNPVILEVEYGHSSDIIGECIVSSVNISDRQRATAMNKDREYSYWLPSGLKFKTEDTKLDDIIKLCEKEDIIEYDEERDKKETTDESHFNRYWKENRYGGHVLYVEYESKVKNDVDNYPVYIYKFNYDPDTEEILYSHLDTVYPYNYVHQD